jgi:hypothetical protein
VSKEFVTTGFVEDGTLTVRNRAKFEREMASWKDGEVIVTVEQARATRSMSANALYWAGFVGPISEYTGYEPYEVHAFLKKKFLPSKHMMIQNAQGEVIDETDIDPTTTKLNVNEFSDYLRSIKMWALDTLGIDCGSNQEAA